MKQYNSELIDICLHQKLTRENFKKIMMESIFDTDYLDTLVYTVTLCKNEVLDVSIRILINKDIFYGYSFCDISYMSKNDFCDLITTRVMNNLSFLDTFCFLINDKVVTVDDISVLKTYINFILNTPSIKKGH